MLARLCPFIVLSAVAGGAVRADSIREVPRTAEALLVVGTDAFNDGGAVGTMSGLTGALGFISRPGGTTIVAPPAGATNVVFFSASANGDVAVGGSDGGFALRYSTATGLSSIGGLPGHDRSQANRVSSNGATVVGSSSSSTVANSQTAFRWTSAGMTGLGRLPEASFSSAFAVSGDGSVVVGDSGTRAFRWTQAGGMEALAAPGLTLSQARAVSADGQAIWGQTSTGVPFRWTAAGTTLLPTGGGSAGVADVSDDGLMVVGSMSIGSVSSAVVWAGSELVNLNLWLPSQGVDLQGWRLSVASGVSADGRTILTIGERNGETGAIVVALDRAIPAPGAA
ncbi:MAG: hypothetical protein K2Q20_10725, partial [Phycisphaerales bacterium]|nr:hypothetical protein [Phycisphaerales bacterium]